MNNQYTYPLKDKKALFNRAFFSYSGNVRNEMEGIMANILVIDDEKGIRDLLYDMLKADSYHVKTASSGHKGLEMIAAESFHLIILDVMMPVMDGWCVLKEIRQTTDIPVIMLTARNLENDEVLGFELGADEYITKPFRKAILIARVKAVLKRNGQVQVDDDYEFGILKINPKAIKVFVNEICIGLSHTEYELLINLVLNRGVALSREQLLDKVWGMDYFGGTRTVDTHIKRLRNKLGEASNYISTVRGVGYRFEGDVHVD